jgi:hypothetical protein
MAPMRFVVASPRPLRRRCRPSSAPLLGWEIPIRTLARVVASSVTPALHAGRDKEALYVVALSRVPRGERGRPVHSGYRSAPTAFRPLVRVSVDRHATTGTCEIGQLAKYAHSSTVARENRTRAQNFFCRRAPTKTESIVKKNFSARDALSARRMARRASRRARTRRR